MPKNARPYQVGLHQRLRDDPEHAKNYINAAAEDSIEAFLLALRDVVEATTGMSELAAAAAKNRENLYRILSEEGNPRLLSLWDVVRAMGLRLQVASVDDTNRECADMQAEVLPAQETYSPRWNGEATPAGFSSLISASPIGTATLGRHIEQQAQTNDLLIGALRPFKLTASGVKTVNPPLTAISVQSAQGVDCDQEGGRVLERGVA